MMSNDFVLRWSGPAAAVGGPLWLLPWTGWLAGIGDTLGFLLAIVGLLLVAFGLFGLYRRLPPKRSSKNVLFFAVAMLGILLVIASALGGILTGASLSGGVPILAALLAAGVIVMIIGLAGMGFSAVSGKSLGSLSFTPLALVLALLGYVVSVGLTISNPAAQPVVDFFEILLMVCWLLLAVGLWTTQGSRLAVAPPA